MRDPRACAASARDASQRPLNRRHNRFVTWENCAGHCPLALTTWLSSMGVKTGSERAPDPSM
uniref:Uncharacterized protein n=1 Tax=Human herpesvirus 2 TaxID=10310 RepID=A0A481TU05_HHV2|nr:hypothetical protein [Human alphaherpesvirus 2]QBH85114.1 hypothetical protein [Human alphaherpesvirus 2]